MTEDPPFTRSSLTFSSICLVRAEEMQVGWWILEGEDKGADKGHSFDLLEKTIYIKTRKLKKNRGGRDE